jgi:hypothetical protein
VRGYPPQIKRHHEHAKKAPAGAFLASCFIVNTHLPAPALCRALSRHKIIFLVTKALHARFCCKKTSLDPADHPFLCNLVVTKLLFCLNTFQCLSQRVHISCSSKAVAVHNLDNNTWSN